MKSNPTASEILLRCEKELRQLVADAAGRGVYSDVVELTELARAVGALAAKAGDSTAQQSLPDPEKPTAPQSTSTAKRKSGTDYPLFYRQDGDLIKVGWSKKAKKEYHHRAPKRAVEAVTAALQHLGTKKKLFTGDALLPLKHPSDGEGVPDYQAYLALAWIKSLGIVGQRGLRGGYTLLQRNAIETTIDSAWPHLPEWRG